MNSSFIGKTLFRKIYIEKIFSNNILQRSKLFSTVVAQNNTNDLKEEESIKDNQINPLSHEDYFDVKRFVNLKKLFDARVHLGHHEGTWDSRTKPYIHGQRSTQLVIDLNKTVECLTCALNVVSHVVYRNGIIAFISTNPRFDYIIQRAARESHEYFITTGWQKGLFTNSNKLLGTTKLPDLIIAFNLSRFEKIREAVTEAAMCNIPVIGIVDTDCDPSLITYPVPANDDTVESVETLLYIFQQAILNAKSKRKTDDSLNEIVVEKAVDKS